MKYYWFTCFLLAIGSGLFAQDIPKIKATQLLEWKNADTDTVYVFNFWATWCAPCVAELPEFEKLNQAYAAKKVKVILVNTDFRRDFEKKVVPFVKRKALKSQVVFMDESNPNNWIDLVSTAWSGAIPATLIVNNHLNAALFFEKQVSYQELEDAVQEALGYR